MKSFSILVSIVLLVGTSCTRSGTSEQNKKFCEDIVRVLSRIHEARMDSRHTLYEKVYAVRQSVDDARLIIKPWGDDKEPIRQRTLDYLNSGLSDLRATTDLLLDSNFPLDEKGVAEVKTRIEAGLQKLYEATLIAMHPKTGLELSKTDRENVSSFTKRVFEKRLAEFKDKLDTDTQYKPGWEIYGAAVLAGQFPK